MLRKAFNRHALGGLAAALIALGALAVVGAVQLEATVHQEPGPRAIVSSEFHISRDAAELSVRTDDGRSLSVVLRDDRVWIDGREVGPARRGRELDRAWRALLNDAMESPSGELASLLVGWNAPAGGEMIADALTTTLLRTPTPVALDDASPDALSGPSADSLARLERMIEELRAEKEGLSAENRNLRRRLDDGARLELPGGARVSRGAARSGPFRWIWQGLGRLFQTFAAYAVLVGIGFATVFFGRKYLEGVADTARSAPLRSGLVGLAASFLALPVFILGIAALAISIIGIPLLFVWIPLYPVAAVLAVGFGYLAIAHAAGESLAERRFEGGELYRRANSYYYVLTGAALLLILFAAAGVVHMAGPWLGFLKGILKVLAVTVTWIAFMVGLGAVLISRAGTRPGGSARPTADLGVDEVFEEGSHV